MESEVKNIDKFLAWVNVRLLILQKEADSLQDGRKKHETVVRIGELRRVKDSYNRINGGNS